MAENGDKERVRQLERRAAEHDALIRQHSEACTVARLDLADRLGRIETTQQTILSALERGGTRSAKVVAAVISGTALVVSAVIALLV